MQPMLNIAIRAARKAGEIILKKSDQLNDIQIYNKSANNYVTSVDVQAEKEILFHLRKAYPEHGFLSEESGSLGNAESEYCWIIDPLDGTTNFIKQMNYSGVSIALQVNNKTQLAVIYNPFEDALYTAARGGGAQLNGRRLRVSNQKTIPGAFFSASITASKLFKPSYYVEMGKMQREILSFRYGGALSLDLAKVASGHFDAAWTANAQIWDVAAADLLVREAGGMVCELNGGVNYLKSGNLICGNAKVVVQLIKRLSTHLNI